MGRIVLTRTTIPDLIVIEPQVFGDARGYFVETWNKRDSRRDRVIPGLCPG